MKKSLLALGILFGLATASAAHAAAFPPALGGTGTTIVPASGTVLIGNGAGTYTPALLTPGTDIVISNASGSVTIAVNNSAFLPSSTVYVATLNGQSGAVTITSSTLGVATNTISLFNGNGFTTTTIQSVLNALSVSGLLTYNSSTGVFGYTSSSLALGSASQHSFSDFLASSTLYVTSVNGNSGVVTITSSSLGVPPGSNYLASSTVYVTSVNGSSGALTITSSSLGVATNTISLFNGNGFITSAPATSTINGVTGPTFTFSIVATSSASSITTSSAQVFLNLLKYNSSTDITITSTGTIIFANHNISQFTNDAGYGTSNVSTSTANTWSALQTFSGGVGNSLAVGSDTISGSSSTPSTIENLNGVCNVPMPYSSSTYGDFGIWSTNCYNAKVALGYESVVVYVGSPGILSGMWSQGILASSTDTTFQIECARGANIYWTGTNTSTITNFKSDSNSGWNGGAENCNVNGGGEGGQSTFWQFGGSGGSYGITFSHDYIHNFHQGLVPTSNAPMPIVEDSQFESIPQPIDFNYSGTTNSGENNAFMRNVFGNCYSGFNQATATEIYFFNTAGVGMYNNSFDDCHIDFAGGNFGSVISGGWFENPTAQTQQLPGVPYVTVATSTANSINNVSLLGVPFMNDASSTTSTPPEFVLNSSYVYAAGDSAYANGTASSVNTFASDGASGATTICGFVNASGTTNQGVLSLVNSVASSGNLPSGKSAGMNCVIQAGNGFAYGMYASGNVITYYGGDGVYEQQNMDAQGGIGDDVTTYFGNGGSSVSKFSSSTIEVGDTFALGQATYAANFTLPSTANSGHSDYTFTGSSWATTTLPVVNLTQDRIYIFKNRGTSSTNIVASTTAPDFIWLGTTNASATNYVLNPGSSTMLINDGTYWDQLWHQ